MTWRFDRFSEQAARRLALHQNVEWAFTVKASQIAGPESYSDREFVALD